MEERTDFWYECDCMEKENDTGELVMYISEKCEWNLFKKLIPVAFLNAWF